MTGFGAVLARELRLTLRQPGEAATVVMFFVLATILFPFGIGPEANILARIAAGVLWVAALLAAMLSLDRLFQADYEDGSLEILVLSPVALELAVGAKILAHWLTTGVPLMIATPIIAVLLNLDAAGYWALIAAMALGTPTISLIGAVGAALTLGARRGGILLSLLVLPLIVPVLIFGAAAVDASIAGIAPRQQLMIAPRQQLLTLAALLVAASILAPWASAAAVRQAME